MTFEQWYSGCGSRLKPGMGYSFEDISRMAWEAATASQQKELERLRETLNFVAGHFSSDWPERCQCNVLAARFVLNEWPNVEFSGGPLGISTTKDGRGPSAGTQG